MSAPPLKTAALLAIGAGTLFGLGSADHLDDALAVLKESLREHPNDRAALSAAVTFSNQKGDSVAALDCAERLARLIPEDPRLRATINELRHRKPGGAA